VLVLYTKVTRAGTLQHGVAELAADEHLRPLAIAGQLGEKWLDHDLARTAQAGKP
jgi:hypothetical protein